MPPYLSDYFKGAVHKRGAILNPLVYTDGGLVGSKMRRLPFFSVCMLCVPSKRRPEDIASTLPTYIKKLTLSQRTWRII